MRRYVSAPQNVASSRVPPCPKSRWRSLSPPYLSAKSHCFNCLATCMQPESPITPLTMRQLSLDANPTPTRRQGDANVTPAPRTRAATSPYIFGHVSVPRPGKAALALHTSAGFGPLALTPVVAPGASSAGVQPVMTRPAQRPTVGRRIESARSPRNGMVTFETVAPPRSARTARRLDVGRTPAADGSAESNGEGGTAR